jgi:hypothetical protein
MVRSEDSQSDASVHQENKAARDAYAAGRDVVVNYYPQGLPGRARDPGTSEGTGRLVREWDPSRWASITRSAYRGLDPVCRPM